MSNLGYIMAFMSVFLWAAGSIVKHRQVAKSLDLIRQTELQLLRQRVAGLRQTNALMAERIRNYEERGL